jgi:hypothetical protein
MDRKLRSIADLTALYASWMSLRGASGRTVAVSPPAARLLVLMRDHRDHHRRDLDRHGADCRMAQDR